MRYSAYKIDRARLIEAINMLGPGFDVRVVPHVGTGESGPGENMVKTFMFPQPEVLFTFKKAPPTADDVDLLRESSSPHTTTLLFGIRPCDARSIHLNGLAYEEDTYFWRRIEGAIIVGYLCKAVLSTCFCQRVGSGPDDTRYMDVVMMDVEGDHDALLLHGITEKGMIFLSQELGPLLIKCGGAKEEIEQSLGSRQYPKDTNTLDTLLSSDLMALYNAPFWDQLKDGCLNCGICTFRCPTCYCFDIQDETLGAKGRRIRYWDSCMFPLFTQHASGHNPRGGKIFRVRNRFMHKLKYFPDRFGAISCVGCGRCVRDCPVNIDIREVLDNLLEVARS